MAMIRRARALGMATVLVFVPLIGATGQTQSPTPSQNSSPPAAVKPQTETSQPQNTQSEARTPASQATAGPLVGLAAVASDGAKLGTVQSVKNKPDGTTAAILLKMGGFLGFGGHLVAIPEGKFARRGDNVQVSMTADQVKELPATTE